MNEPTKEQLASREELLKFLEKVKNPILQFGAKIRSEWFSRPDEELKGWLERGRAIEEIRDSLGYRLILSQTDKEILWAQQQLEVCEEPLVRDLRMYLRSLRFVKDFLLTTEKNADIAGSVLAGREAAIGRESHAFVKNATVGERY